MNCVVIGALRHSLHRTAVVCNINAVGAEGAAWAVLHMHRYMRHAVDTPLFT